MNDLAQIKRLNQEAARRARFPLRVGNYRLKRQPRDLPDGARLEAVYTDRTGREYFLDLPACTAWIKEGTVPNANSLLSFH